MFSGKKCEIVLKIARLPYRLVNRNLNVYQAMDLLDKKEADITSLAFRITLDRLKQAAFTTPIDYLSFGFVAQENG